MSVNLHISVTVRKYDPSCSDAVRRAIEQIIKDEELDEDLPPLVEKLDGDTGALFTQNDRSMPVIISGAYSWVPEVQRAMANAAAQANGGPCEVIFAAEDADVLEDEAEDGADVEVDPDSRMRVCMVCTRNFSSEPRGGEWIKFKYHSGCWICNDHVAAARQRSNLAWEPAIREIRKSLAIGVKRLMLIAVGPNRAKVFGIVRQAAGASPPEALKLLDHLPARIAEGLPEIFEPWRRALSEAGATVEVQPRTSG